MIARHFLGTKERTKSKPTQGHLRNEGEGLGDGVEHDGEHDDDGEDASRHYLRVVDPHGLGQQLAKEQRRHRQGRRRVR